MKRPNLNKIIEDNLNKHKFQSKSKPTLPKDQFSQGGTYISDHAKATQFGQYKGGGWLDHYAQGGEENNPQVSSKIIPTDALKTFDFGDKEGTPQTDAANKTIHNNIVNNPDKPMFDEGETFNEAVKTFNIAVI